MAAKSTRTILAVMLLAAASAAAAQDLGIVAANAMKAALDAPHGGEAEKVRRRFECVTVVGIRVESVTVDRNTAAVSLDVMAEEPLFPSHWLVRLRRETSGWRAAGFDVREQSLAGSIAAAPDAAARRALLAAHPELVTPELARRLCERGDELDARSESARAEELARLARGIAAECGDLAGEARALWLTGKTFDSRDLLQPARRAYEEGHALAERAHDTGLIAATLAGIGTEIVRGGEVGRTEELTEALRLARSIHDDRVAAMALMRLAFCDHTEGKYAEALRKYDETVVLARRAEDRVVEGGATASIGVTYDYMNNHALAFEYVLRGVEILRRAKNMVGVIRYLRNLADMETWDIRYADAEKHLREVDVLLRRYPNDRTSAFVCATRAQLAFQRHDHAAAAAACSKGLALAKKAGVKSLVTNFSQQLASVRVGQRRYDEAIALANEAVERSQNVTPSFEIYWHAKLELGRALARQGKLVEARAAFNDAIGAIEGTQSRVPPGRDDQQFFFADKTAPYYEMFGTFIGDRPEEAVRWVERARARTLLEFLAMRKHASTRSLTADERAEEAGTERGIADLNIALNEERTRRQPDPARLETIERDLAQKRMERSLFVRRLYEAHPDLALARGDVPQASIAEIQKMIPPDGVVLEYASLNERNWLIVLTRDAAPQIHTIPVDYLALRGMIERLGAELAAHGVGFRANARKLYDLLLRPAEKVLKAKRVICIIPDLAIGNLPFQALIGRDGRYVIEHYAVFYAPSLAFLAWRANHLRQRPSDDRAPQLLALGNPRISADTANRARARTRGESLGPLPEAEQEVRALKEMYGTRATLRTGSDATEDDFKAEAPRYRVLHLATHGMYDDSDPMYSHLVLSRHPGDVNDGLLEAREVADLDLDADLVVLSACETGRGVGRVGEGMIGLSWALLAAGCDTAILTHFKIDSASSRDLMIAFHRRLVQHRAGNLAGRVATDALREAELAMLESRSHSHPFYWASFIAVGRGW